MDSERTVCNWVGGARFTGLGNAARTSLRTHGSFYIRKDLSSCVASKICCVQLGRCPSFHWPKECSPRILANTWLSTYAPGFDQPNGVKTCCAQLGRCYLVHWPQEARASLRTHGSVFVRKDLCRGVASKHDVNDWLGVARSIGLGNAACASL